MEDRCIDEDRRKTDKVLGWGCVSNQQMKAQVTINPTPIWNHD